MASSGGGKLLAHRWAVNFRAGASYLALSLPLPRPRSVAVVVIIILPGLTCTCVRVPLFFKLDFALSDHFVCPADP